MLDVKSDKQVSVSSTPPHGQMIQSSSLYLSPPYPPPPLLYTSQIPRKNFKALCFPFVSISLPFFCRKKVSCLFCKVSGNRVRHLGRRPYPCMDCQVSVTPSPQTQKVSVGSVAELFDVWCRLLCLAVWGFKNDVARAPI